MNLERMRRMLALDLDGTTFGKGVELSEGNRRRLEQARELEPIEHLCGLADYFVRNNGGTVIAMPGGANKWRGASYVAEREGISPENVIPAGNYYNDIELIRGAGVGIAVRNAPEEVRAQADYVTERDHMEDAAAELIERFLLDGGAR